MISSTAAPGTHSAFFKYTGRGRKIALSLPCFLPLPASAYTHTPAPPSPVHKGSLSCSAQPCNACKKQELPYSHSLNRLLSPSWLGSCSHSCFNPWEQGYDSKRLFTHRSGLPPSNLLLLLSSLFPRLLGLEFLNFLFMYSFLIQAASKTLLRRLFASSFHLQRNSIGELLPPPPPLWTSGSPGLPFCSVALRERKRVEEREGGSVQTGRRRRRPTGCGRKEPERGWLLCIQSSADSPLPPPYQRRTCAANGLYQFIPLRQGHFSLRREEKPRKAPRWPLKELVPALLAPRHHPPSLQPQAGGDALPAQQANGKVSG